MATIDDMGKDYAGLRWRVRWRVGTRQRSKSFERKADAAAFRSRVAVEVASGMVVDPRAGKVTVATLAEHWMAAVAPPSLTEATYERYRSSVSTHVIPAFGSVPVAQIRPSDVRAWVAELSRQGLSSSSVRQAAQRLAQILDTAVADDRIRRNPARGIKLPSQPAPRKHRYLTDEQLLHLARVSRAPEHILTLGYTGMRFSESIALDIANLDFRHHRIGVYGSYTQVGSKVVRGDTKTHRNREIPMPEPLADMLAAFVKGRHGLVFTSPDGKVIRLANWRNRVWEPAIADTSWSITPHDLRHTAASIAVDSGANIMAVATMLGHEDPSVTLHDYADLFPAHLDDLTDRLSERMRIAMRHLHAV